MRSKFLLLVAACMLLVGMAAPALAARQPVGDRINVLFADPGFYPANEPFHIVHGWGALDPSITHSAVGHLDFRLDVDGEDQGKGKLVNSTLGGPEENLVRVWLFNFEDGMPAGEVTFTGHWFMPCLLAVDQGLWFEACPKPNAAVEVITATHTVTFTP